MPRQPNGQSPCPEYQHQASECDGRAVTRLVDALVDKQHQIDELQLDPIRAIVSKHLKRAAREEATIRLSTITFRKSLIMTENLIVKSINEEWIKKKDRPFVDFWFEREHAFVRFMDVEEKMYFLEWMKNNNFLGQVKNALLERNSNGTHFKRRPVCLVLPSVKREISSMRIFKTLQHVMGSNCYLSTPIEGRGYTLNKPARHISFMVNANAFRRIFIDMNGSVAYMNQDASIRTRLHFKVNCKPIMCGKCSKFVRHECNTRCCYICSSSEHTAGDCSAYDKYCSNCLQRGHGARDYWCPKYIWAYTREIFKQDIPLEFYELGRLRDQLAQALLLW